MDAINQDLTGQSLQDFLQSELTTLCSNLDETYSVLSQKWIGTELKGHLERLDQEQEKKIKHYQDEIGSHENNIKKIQGLAKNNKKALEDQVQRLTDLRQELKILTTQTQSALQQGEQLHSEISNTQQNIHHRNEALKGTSQDTEKTHKELEQALGFYRDRLDMHFQKISGGRLQYCFSSVDKENPDVTCCFCLKINGDRTYTVSDFSPELDGVQELEEKLNSTNNLRSFIVAVRKKFVKALNPSK